jgi:uncharacterized protein YyaL (SSP411 family)
MLYDQAQLAVSYLEACQISGERAYAEVARSIFEYLLRDLRHPAGAFFSAEDADSAPDPARPTQKSEGAFYLWSRAELDSLLGPERAAWFARSTGCRDSGNVAHDPHSEFTGRNILFAADPAALASPEFDACRRILLEARSKRPRPHLDDKILAGWNALAISAFARGAQAFSVFDPEAAERFGAAARAAARFLMDNLYDPATGTLHRRWHSGSRDIPAFLDDYAALVQAHIDLYETFFEWGYLDTAAALASAMLARFSGDGALYSSPSAPDLLLRLTDDYDGAEPAGNSLAAAALLRLSGYLRDEFLRDAALAIFRAFAPRLNAQPLALPRMLSAWMFALARPRQIVLAGPDPAPFLAVIRSSFLPDTLLAVNPAYPAWPPMPPVQGRTAAYLCENFACQLPITDPDELASRLAPPT